MTFIMTIILLVLFTVSSIWIWYITTLPNIIGSTAAIWGSRFLAIGVGLCFPVLFVINPERYILWFQFTSTGIEYCVLFRRKQLLPYSMFPYIMHGKYKHGTYWRDFIVFSSRMLTDSELCRINHVAPSKEIVKIRYSENAKKRITSLLPPKQKSRVAAIAPSKITKKKN